MYGKVHFSSKTMKEKMDTIMELYLDVGLKGYSRDIYCIKLH